MKDNKYQKIIEPIKDLKVARQLYRMRKENDE